MAAWHQQRNGVAWWRKRGVMAWRVAWRNGMAIISGKRHTKISIISVINNNGQQYGVTSSARNGENNQQRNINGAAAIMAKIK
jgi:hypothetical protein